MLRITSTLSLLALAHLGRAQWCDLNSQYNVGGFNLEHCRLSSGITANVFEVKLHVPSIVQYVSLAVKNPTVQAAINFTVRVDGKWCGQITEFSKNQIFEITCANGGIAGSTVEWSTEHPIPNYFEFCNFNVCGVPTNVEQYGHPVPQIDITDQTSSQSSTWEHEGLKYISSMAHDNNPETCATNVPKLTKTPWWTVDMGAVFSVHYLKITNTYQDSFRRLGNVMITVDGKPCGAKKVDANWLHVWITCTEQPVGQKLVITLEEAPVDGILSLCEVFIFGVAQEIGSQVNLHGHSTKQSTAWDSKAAPSNAIDGDLKSCSSAWYKNDVGPEWWSVDLGAPVTVDYIEITTAPGIAHRLSMVLITVDGKNCTHYLQSADFDATKTRIECSEHPTGNELRIEYAGPKNMDSLLSLCDVKVFGMAHESTAAPHKITLRKDVAKQSSDFSSETVASMAIDGKADTYTQTKSQAIVNPWWSVDMGSLTTVHYVEITNLAPYTYRLGNVVVTVDGTPCGGILLDADALNVRINCTAPPTGQVLKIQLENAPYEGILSLSEVEVFGTAGYILASKAAPVPEIQLIGHVTAQSGPVQNSASEAIDGNDKTFTTNEVSYTTNPWWTVDMGGPVLIHYVEITNHHPLKNDQYLELSVDGKPCGPNVYMGNKLYMKITCPEQPTGQMLMVLLRGGHPHGEGSLSLAQVKVFGYKLLAH